VGLSNRATEFGACAGALRLTELDLNNLGHTKSLIFRRQLYSDWIQFWLSNASAPLEGVAQAKAKRVTKFAQGEAALIRLTRKKSNSSHTAAPTISPPPTNEPTSKPVNIYGGLQIPVYLQYNASLAMAAAQRLASQSSILVEQSPSNLVTSRFLQSAWGAERTAFVFMLRHPLAVPRCRYFKCNVIARLEAWLAAHEVMLADLEFLSRFVVIHYEGFTRSANTLVHHLHRVAWGGQTGLGNFKFLDHTFLPPLVEEAPQPAGGGAAEEFTEQHKSAVAEVRNHASTSESDGQERLRRRHSQGKAHRASQSNIKGMHLRHTHIAPEQQQQQQQQQQKQQRQQHRVKGSSAAQLKVRPARFATKGQRPVSRDPGKGQHAKRRLETSSQYLSSPNATQVDKVTTKLSLASRKKNAEQAKARQVPLSELVNATYLPDKFPYMLVSLRRSVEEEQWERDYRSVLRKDYHLELASQMRQLSARLAVFCYSVEHLEVLLTDCGADHWKNPKYVWKMKV